MSVRVYRRVSADELSELAVPIASVLFGLSRDAVLRGDSFSIARGSGWIYFRDETKLDTDGRKRAVASNEREALAQALAYVQGVAEATPNESTLAAAGIDAVLPPRGSLFPMQTVPVRHPEERWIDHWLCRFGVTVRASDVERERAVPVAGAGVDLRIGAQGRVIGLTSRWAPLRKPPLQRTRRHMPALPQEGVRGVRLVYRIGDEAQVQTLLAPYWYVVEGHHSTYVPASDCSLACDLVQNFHENEIEVTAIAGGGQGAYEYTWGLARVLEFPPVIGLLQGSTRAITLADGRSTTVSTVRIPRIVCDVLIDVRDTATGARIQLRRAIFPAMSKATPEAVS